MNAHPLAQLARTHLSGSTRIRHVPAVPADLFHEAVARYGAGIDHLAGEMPLALLTVNLNAQAQRARDYSANYIVTDRRLFGRAEAGSIPRHFVDVPYAYVTGAPSKPSAMAQSITVPLGQQYRKLYIAPKQLQAYFAAMAATVPPAHRTFGSPPPPHRSAQDPTGAWTAVQAVGTADVRTWAPLRTLAEAQRRGLIDTDEAAALVPPMVQLAKAIAFGRGNLPQGGWHSTLPGPVFDLAIRAVLGEPAAVLPAQTGHTWDFRIGASSGAGAAVASTVVGLAALATLGFGWVSTSHGHKLATLRVQTNHTFADTAYHLFGTSGTGWDPLSLHWWRAANAIHQSLFRLEARYLLGQAAFGPHSSPQELLTRGRADLEARVASLIGPTNLAIFYPSV